jgi:transposase InsO family protein
VEVWTFLSLQRFLVLFFIELSTRRVRIASIVRQANGLWMSQVARDLTDPVDGPLSEKRYLIHDRDPLFTVDFLKMLAPKRIESVRLPPRSPNLNAYAERFVRTIEESCLDHLVLFGEASLRKTDREFIGHDHSERNHQGLGYHLIAPELCPLMSDGPVQRRKRLGGLLNYYYRAA